MNRYDIALGRNRNEPQVIQNKIELPGDRSLEITHRDGGFVNIVVRKNTDQTVLAQHDFIMKEITPDLIKNVLRLQDISPELAAQIARAARVADSNSLGGTSGNRA